MQSSMHDWRTLDVMTLRELLERYGLDLDQQLHEASVIRNHKPVDEPVPSGHPRRIWQAPTLDIAITLAPWETP